MLTCGNFSLFSGKKTSNRINVLRKHIPVSQNNNFQSKYFGNWELTLRLRLTLRPTDIYIRVYSIRKKVFKSRSGKICGRQPFERTWRAWEDHIPSNVWKGVFHKFYLDHSWKLCPIYFYFLYLKIQITTPHLQIYLSFSYHIYHIEKYGYQIYISIYKIP